MKNMSHNFRNGIHVVMLLVVVGFELRDLHLLGSSDAFKK
jgi:hypothetical protein